MLIRTSIIVAALSIASNLSASTTTLQADLTKTADAWRVVLDGVMGGRSSGRVRESDKGTIVFAGNLSMENNGGFSQIRTAVQEGSLSSDDGLEIKVLGDGRTYQFDIRVSNVRLMAGGFQLNFDTNAGEWKTIRLPFDDFRLYSFGRRIPNPPAFDTAKIESIGITLGDKNPGGFRIEVDSIIPYSNSGSKPTSSSASDNSLGSVAKAADLNTLMDLVALSGLSLPADEDVTIFAPTDAAFAALPKETVELLTSPEGLEMLQSVLTYHIVLGDTRSNELFNMRSATSLNGQELGIDLDPGLTVAGSSVSIVDVEFERGVIHVIDSVLLPEFSSILDLAVITPQLSTLTAAVTAAGIGDQISNENGPFTVFAPVNSAFAKLPVTVVEDLLNPQNRAQLIDVLGLHIIPGRISSSELLANQRARSFFGIPVEFSIKNGKLQVQGANIIKADIQASNGVVHLIDSVITPSVSTASTNQSPSLDSRAMNRAASSIYELAINRGAPLFNNGQQRGCVSVYEVAIESILALGAGSLDRLALEQLQMGLAEAETQSDWTQRAWIYRRALDAANDRFIAGSR